MVNATTDPMPAVFIGHGSPMNAIETNRWTRAWSDFARGTPRPRAILVVSAHWYIEDTAVTAMALPKTIHDFTGFPPELFAVDYPAPGDPALADDIVELLAPVAVRRDTDSWGLDHGTWSVLAHMYPDADIPVVQLSIDATKPPSYHVELGAALEPLRHSGVLIVGSGSVVHNLARMNWGDPDGATDWNVAFDTAATEVMTQRPADIAELFEHQNYRLAAPTPDHLLPLLYIAGAARAAQTPVSVLTDGPFMSSLSMTSYLVPAPPVDANKN